MFSIVNIDRWRSSKRRGGVLIVENNVFVSSMMRAPGG